MFKSIVAMFAILLLVQSVALAQSADTEHFDSSTVASSKSTGRMIFSPITDSNLVFTYDAEGKVVSSEVVLFTNRPKDSVFILTLDLAIRLDSDGKPVKMYQVLRQSTMVILLWTTDEGIQEVVTLAAGNDDGSVTALYSVSFALKNGGRRTIQHIGKFRKAD